MRAAHDAIGAPALLVSVGVVRGLPAYARVAVPGGVAVPVEWSDAVDDALGSRARCDACARGEPCAAWDWTRLAYVGVTPRRPGDEAERDAAVDEVDEVDAKTLAAAALGLTPAQAEDPAEVRRAFRAAAFLAHPDRGGTDACMAELNAARDALVGRDS